MKFKRILKVLTLVVLATAFMAGPVNAVTYNYDSNNRLLSADYENGQVFLYYYDDVGILRGITAGPPILAANTGSFPAIVYSIPAANR